MNPCLVLEDEYELHETSTNTNCHLDSHLLSMILGRTIEVRSTASSTFSVSRMTDVRRSFKYETERLRSPSTAEAAASAAPKCLVFGYQ